MCIRDSFTTKDVIVGGGRFDDDQRLPDIGDCATLGVRTQPVSYTHLRAHETVLDLVCRLLLDKKTLRN